MEFYNTEVGKILAHGIHEQNSSLGQISSCVYLLKSEKENGDLTNEEFLKYMDMIESAIKKNKDGMDYIYIKLKEIEEKK